MVTIFDFTMKILRAIFMFMYYSDKGFQCDQNNFR